MNPARPVMLLALGQSGWEAELVAAVVARLSAVDVHRAVDVSNLLAATNETRPCVVAVDSDFPRLDAAVVAKLVDADVSLIGIAADPSGAARLEGFGIDLVVSVSVGDVGDAVGHICQHWAAVQADESAVESIEGQSGVGHGLRQVLADSGHQGSLVAVWGAPGAPGRTTIAVTLAQLLAQSGRDVLLADADSNAAGVGPMLCLEAEGSGMIAACHHAERGSLDAPTLARLARTIDDGFRVLTGISHVSRRAELRAAAMSRVWQVAGMLAEVVVADVGGCIDDGSLSLDADVANFGISTSGQSAAVTALGAADELVAVSSCEPTAVARLLSHLPTIRSLAPSARVHVVLNRVRAPIVRNQAAAEELRHFIESQTRSEHVVLVHEDRGTVDAAVVRGLTPFEHSRRSTIVRDVAGLCAGMQSPLVATA